MKKIVIEFDSLTDDIYMLKVTKAMLPTLQKLIVKWSDDNLFVEFKINE